MKKFIALAFGGMILTGLCQAQPTQLGIDRNAGISRITVQGEPNRDYTLLGSDMSPTNWTFLSTLSFTNNSSQSWFDSASASMPARFYRALQLNPNTLPEYADDFRLIDHQGVSRSLYYYDYTISTNVKAIVLIFTGNGCSNVAQMVSTIKSLRDQFTPQGVLFWMIDANSADNRSNIVTEANALGITNIPILHDRAQLVANSFHATTTPEVVCVNTLDWSIFYRGTIDDRMGSNPVSTTQYYLSNALTSFLAGGTVTPRQTQTRGCDITLTSIPTPSYSADIAPLLLDKCVRCHSPGNIAPFAMTNYAAVSNKATQMRIETLAGRMPPWHADPFYQSFTNDISLKTNESAMLVKWLDAGAPRGGGIDPLTNAPPQTNYPFVWPAELGTPDVIIPIGTQDVPASGQIDYVNVAFTYNGPTLPLRAAVILPGTVSVVHHIAAGNALADNVINSFMTLYVPGVYIGAFPSNTYKLLTNGTYLGFQLHYTANGTHTNDSSLLGLYTNATVSGSPLIQTSVADSSSSWTIPANTNEYQWIRSNAAFSTNVWLYEVYPHMHTRGLRAKYEAIYTNGTSEVLLSVPHYEFHWQTVYRFAQPKYLPKGSYIRYTCAWDNSVMNKELMDVFTDPDNPNNYRYSPTNSVKWGLQTWEEMFIGYYNYSVAP
ncbi:MAG: redoxin domain-containing protein [Verrucomicrobia bacterium]|nr:redoxin domain-containing protein [Verrucomicrobiota bacterium]